MRKEQDLRGMPLDVFPPSHDTQLDVKGRRGSEGKELEGEEQDRTGHAVDNVMI